AASLPTELYAALGRILGYPAVSIRSYLSLGSTPKRFLDADSRTKQVAEAQAPYQETSATTGATPLFSFRQALESSRQITTDQKLRWLIMLDQEGL
ncbi:MAG TPA: hypothetical protein VHZ51_31050, partial [Ktedonobacteraceae bacterium]|nr:hypothetical protein [Ktedonobacteraceae bacterium]